jgi:uncharacterized membrane protein
MNTKRLALIALLSSLIMVTTFFINIPLTITGGGLFHLGRIFIFLIALTMGNKYSIAGAIGLTMFDLLSGYAIWAPVTFVASFGMAILVARIGFRKQSFVTIILAQLSGAVLATFLYYIYEALFISSFTAALVSASVETIGMGISITASTILYPIVLKNVKKLKLEI